MQIGLKTPPRWPAESAGLLGWWRKKQKGAVPLIMIVVVLALLALSGGAVYWLGPAKRLKEETKTGAEKETEEFTQPQIDITKTSEQGGGLSRSSTTTTEELAGWQEYKNERFPYKIKYPPDWYFLKKGYNPPPPVGVMFSNLKEGYQPGVNSASVDIFVLPAEEESLEEIGEVKNLVEEQYYQKTRINVSGEPALRLETPDKSENHFSVYFLHKENSYRIVCAESGTDKPKYSETLEKILNSFTFTDSQTPPGKSEPTTGLKEQKGSTKIKIFLIALDDQGKEGKLVGCGDSVVSVERTIAATSQPPIKEALNELFSVEDQYVASPGYHNALTNSSLKVDQVNIKNGNATVNLSGNYSLAGVCDNPRFKAQIEETVLQFPSIKQASIFLNKIPLDKILSGQGE